MNEQIIPESPKVVKYPHVGHAEIETILFDAAARARDHGLHGASGKQVITCASLMHRLGMTPSHYNMAGEQNLLTIRDASRIIAALYALLAARNRVR